MASRILYFECESGISADMALGALIGLGADARVIAAEVAKVVRLPFDLRAERIEKNGVRGIDVRVVVEEDAHGHNHEHGHPHGEGHAEHHAQRGHGEHMTYARVRDMIAAAGLSERASRYALDIFAVLGTGEAEVHGVALEEVAFHEVGSPASLIDIIGTAVAADLIGIEEICCGAVRDGQGTIACAHGIIPVPVPAVVAMSKRSEIPLEIDAGVTTEMVTPSGYAILNGLGAKFCPGIKLRTVREGFGFG
ncbi:MAG: LarC family nickel insertion protein, partial [Clostridiales Family XIII bacterium]|nr:LarC family nickel insertion protein [Clostridiales Family XIII bacterium]